MSDWDDPLPFIICESGKFQIDAKTVEKLQQIKKPLVSICIAGSYRTGKSYLMNRLIGKSTGFPLGNTVESKTQGIWVWYKDHPDDENKGFLLMDTEGLDNVVKDDETHDSKILSLSILLSGTLIYNAVGKIDSQLIDRLDFITEIPKFIRVKSDIDDDYNFDTVFPHFVLVCRDTILKLKIEGEDVTADEYMERVMLTANKKATTKREKERNEIKLKLRRYFPKRKCFFFVRPISNEEDMLRLEEIKEEDLNLKFTNECTKFCNYVINHSNIKKVTPLQSMTGQILVHLSKIYVDAINSQSVPCMGSAIDSIAKTKNDHLIKECVSQYVKFMSGLEFPISNDEFESAHSQNHASVVKYFADYVFLDESNEYHEKLQVELRKNYLKFVGANCSASQKFCMNILDDLYDPIQEKIRKRSYFKNKGFVFNTNCYYELVKDTEKLQQEYNALSCKGVMENVCLDKFVIKLQKDQKVILNANKILSENNRKIEEETLRREEAQRKIQIRQEILKQKKIHEQMLINDHREQIQAFEAVHKNKIVEAQGKYNELLKNRLKEQQRLLEENFKEEADQLRQQTEALKKEHEENKNMSSFMSIMMGTLLMLIPNPFDRAAGVGLSLFADFFDSKSE